MLKRKLNSLTISEKLKLVTEFESEKTQKVICEEFKIPQSILSWILKNKENIKYQCIEGQGKINRQLNLKLKIFVLVTAGWMVLKTEMICISKRFAVKAKQRMILFVIRGLKIFLL